TFLIDDFESGVSNWTRSDKAKLGLSDIAPSKPTGGAPGSRGAALLAFKSATAGWASLSRPLDGPALAKIGARSLIFWINGGGEKQGVQLQLRAKNAGSDLTFTLPLPINLAVPRWRKVAIPLSDFKGPKGETLAPRLSTVYLLQFIQTGQWDSRFFAIDDVVAKGTGIPIVVAAPVKKPTPVPVAAPVAAPAGAVKVSADFLRVAGAIRAAANVSIGGSYAGPGPSPLEGGEFRGAVGLLKPRFVRLDVGALADLSDSSRPSFDFSRLIRTATRVRALKAEPLIAVSNPPEWGLDARGYAVLCTDAARALNSRGGPAARYFELTPGGDDVDSSTALSYYNAGYGALKTLSRAFRVGGYGAPAGALSIQTAFLRGARGLDFLSVSSFGAQSGSPSDALLLSGARDVSALKTAAGALDKSRFPRAPLFVTQAGLSAARLPGDSVPSDARLVQGVSGAWWAQFMASGSRLADQIFHNDAVNAEWGLLNPEGPRAADGQIQMAYPSYYSLWLWNTFFPPGSSRVVASSSSQSLFVAAANTPTAHNVLLVNNSSAPQTAQLGIRGFPVLREARIRVFDDPQKTVRFAALPKSPFQTIELAPFAVAVVQFIEPPKR
ncbi:MAG TPA: hypothetical protein VF627_07795, partial [Abditibacterium sp.]